MRNVTGVERNRRKAEAKLLVRLYAQRPPEWMVFGNPLSSKHRREATFDWLMGSKHKRKSNVAIAKAIKKNSGLKIEVV